MVDKAFRMSNQSNLFTTYIKLAANVKMILKDESGMKSTLRANLLETYLDFNIKTLCLSISPKVERSTKCLVTFVVCHLRSCVLHARMSDEYPHSMAAASTAEDLSVTRDRSSSVSFTAGMGIALRGPTGAPFSSKVLDRNSVVVPKGFDLPGTKASAVSTKVKEVGTDTIEP
eukprot:scaffold365_cov361-Pavlova_lutheri.AAC.4